MDAPITVAELDHSYGRGALRKQILFGINTEIPAGEIVIVTGPSGSGKTTLLTIVGALRSAQSGSVRVLGEELRDAKARRLESVRRQIGFIFQQHNLLGALTAQQNVELGLRMARRMRGAALRRRAAGMLESVGMAEHRDKKPEQLSGGQRQRVAIARALGAEPRLLLADEPTASLDKQSGREVVERMQTLAKEHGTTILMVTHDNRILDVADRIMHLEDGRLQTFTDAVIANTEHMMQMLAENRQKQPLESVVEEMDETRFRASLAELTQESQHFLQATRLANDAAFQSMLERALRAFTARVARLLDAERASLMLVDRATGELVVRVSQDLPEMGEVRIPPGTGIAGAAAASGETIRIDDAYADARFNPEVDRRTGFRTRAVLCVPLRDHDGEVFAVTQLLNRRDDRPFDATDEERFSALAESLGVILETLHRLDREHPARGGDA
ncbi:ATP-binding cassette domain-containing protein [Lentisalinibacter sediminis]|uniref:ATP-binding cassette domain-containing protein n=1 Tax=Lentisalinibacter sediminis TaxID=2992237 RepID=UPI00386886EE